MLIDKKKKERNKLQTFSNWRSVLGKFKDWRRVGYRHNVQASRLHAFERGHSASAQAVDAHPTRLVAHLNNCSCKGGSTNLSGNVCALATMFEAIDTARTIIERHAFVVSQLKEGVVACRPNVNDRQLVVGDIVEQLARSFQTGKITNLAIASGVDLQGTFTLRTFIAFRHRLQHHPLIIGLAENCATPKAPNNLERGQSRTNHVSFFGWKMLAGRQNHNNNM